MGKITLSLSIATLLAFSGSLFCSPAMALETENDQYDSYCRTPILEQFGEIDRSLTITINGKENPLYCTFVNNDIALEKLRETVPEILTEIAQEFSLEELNANNWEQYKYGALNLPNTSQFAAESNIQNQTLVAFFDIYENTTQNKAIEDQVNKTQKSRSISQEQIISLGMMLPTYAPLAQQSENIIRAQSQLMTYALPNVNAAVSYAEKYATNPNKAGYGYLTKLFWGVDCTNFTSQILEASGVGQVVYDSTNMGWWHKNNGGHTYSASWINSDVFARYMGVGYSTTNHRDFSFNIGRGDFIALDNSNDGSWDHMGFVTAAGTDLCYQNGSYRDYKVAQHSTDYHDWVSNNKGWANTGQRLGRVRR